MRLVLLLSMLAVTFASASSAQLEVSTVVVPNDAKTVEALSAVEDAIKSEAGVLPVRLEGPAKLYNILAEECPGATDAYVDSFAADVALLNPELFDDPDSVTLDAFVGNRSYDITTVYIPFCLGSLSERYVVKEGDSLWRIFQQNKDESRFSSWEQFLAETTRLNGDDIEKDALLKGEVISLPTDSWQVPVTASQAKVLVDKLNTVDPLGGMIMTDSPTVWGSANDSQLTEADEESCKTMNELDALHGAETKLWDIADTLMLNDDLDVEYAYKRDKNVPRVAILDTGVDAPRHPAMRRLIRPLTSKRSDMFAYPEDPKSYHGTGVLFTATGGYFLSTLNPLGVAVEAAPYNIHKSICPQPKSCFYGADPGRLRTAMDAALKRGSNISAVNISISFTGEELGPWFREYLGTDKDLLVVVSAGNDGLPIGNDNPIFPAIHGGDESSNLITVAGIDLDNNLLTSSNYSPKKVDIAAWGCNVPVAEFNRSKRAFERKLRSGTSYAAPHVLFAAAMILRERPRDRSQQLTPSEVKIRLMTSADHNLALWNKVRHGRILNFAKALAIHSDVVERKSSGELLHGKVMIGTGDQTVAHICGDKSPLRRDLLSITNLGRAPEAGTQPIMIYTRSTSVGGGVETSWCNAFTNDVMLMDAFTREEILIPTKDIASIVFATYKDEGN